MFKAFETASGVFTPNLVYFSPSTKYIDSLFPFCRITV